jgi:hypothetical protein
MTPRRCTDQVPYREQGHPGDAHRRRNAPSPDHAMGCNARPPRLFLPPGHGLITTRCSSEPIAMIACERNHERGRQEVYEGLTTDCEC